MFLSVSSVALRFFPFIPFFLFLFLSVLSLPTSFCLLLFPSVSFIYILLLIKKNRVIFISFVSFHFSLGAILTMRKDVGVRLVLHGGRGDKHIIGTVESTGSQVDLA